MKKRDSAYWRRRLQKEHPAVFDQLKAGRIRSVRQACIRAGLIRQPSALDELKRAWKKASRTERDEFERWSEAGAARRSSAPLVDPNGFLSIGVVKAARERMEKEGLTVGQLSATLGSHRLDPRLGHILRRRWKPQPDLLKALQSWLTAR
jgi:hypothetical protein